MLQTELDEIHSTLEIADAWEKKGEPRWVERNLLSALISLTSAAVRWLDHPDDGVKWLNEQGYQDVLDRFVAIARLNADRTGQPHVGASSDAILLHTAWLLGTHASDKTLLTLSLAPESASQELPFWVEYMRAMQTFCLRTPYSMPNMSAEGSHAHFAGYLRLIDALTNGADPSGTITAINTSFVECNTNARIMIRTWLIPRVICRSVGTSGSRASSELRNLGHERDSARAKTREHQVGSFIVGHVCREQRAWDRLAELPSALRWNVYEHECAFLVDVMRAKDADAWPFTRGPWDVTVSGPTIPTLDQAVEFCVSEGLTRVGELGVRVGPLVSELLDCRLLTVATDDDGSDCAVWSNSGAPVRARFATESVEITWTPETVTAAPLIDEMTGSPDTDLIARLIRTSPTMRVVDPIDAEPLLHRVALEETGTYLSNSANPLGLADASPDPRASARWVAGVADPR